MDILFNFYKNGLRYTAIGIGFISAFVTSSLPNTARFIISGTSISVLFLFGEYLIRKKIWRLPFIYRRIDFEDKWLCVTFYDNIEPPVDSFKCYNVYHEANIEQDCRNIRIVSSFGEKYKHWESSMMELKEHDGIAYTYIVNYADNSSAEGYEELVVMQRYPESNNGKPILLSGTFSHLAKGKLKAYRGKVVFCSSTMFNEIAETGAMPDHIKEAFSIVKLKNKQNESA